MPTAVASPDPATSGRRSAPIRIRRRRRPLAVVAVSALLAGLVGLGDPAATATPSPSPSDPLAQTLDPNQGTGTGRVVLDQGHVDIGPRIHDGSWSIAIHDDTKVPSLWRSPKDVVLQVGDNARLTAPRSSEYGFLGDAGGRPVYVIPQTQNRDVVWAGWNTQDPEVMAGLSLGATFTVRGVTGPGNLFVFLQSGVLGPPQLLWTSTKKAPQSLFVETNTHTHANWVFTEPGVYQVDFEISGTLNSGKKVSDRQALRFAVGDRTDPARAFAAAPIAATSVTAGGPTPAGATAGPSAARPDGDATAGGHRNTLVWAVAVALLAALLLALLMTTVRARRHKQAALGPAGDGRSP